MSIEGPLAYFMIFLIASKQGQLFLLLILKLR